MKEPKYFKTWMTKILMNLALDSIQKVDFLELDEGMMKHHHVFSIEEKIDLHEAIKNFPPLTLLDVLASLFLNYS